MITVLGYAFLNHFLEHRLKYNHGAVGEVSVHLEVYIQGLVLILVDGHYIHQHLGDRVGYAPLGEYVIYQY